MRRAMTYARDFGAVVASGDAGPASGWRRGDERRAVRKLAGLSGIPREAEIIPLERDLRLAALTRVPLPRDEHFGA
jgi:dihydroorotase